MSSNLQMAAISPLSRFLVIVYREMDLFAMPYQNIQDVGNPACDVW